MASEVLRHIFAGSNRHSSSPPRVQTEVYPGTSSSGDVFRADPFIFEPVQGTISAPSVHYSAFAASCGLPGCSTKYSNAPALQHFPLAPPLAILHKLHSSHPEAIEFHQEGRSTGIHSLNR